MANTRWVLDPTHSELGFKIRHMMITNVSGSFNEFFVESETNGEQLETAKIHARIRMSSIDTNNTQRDEHLRNSDFFEVETYPEMEFKSTRIEKQDKTNYTVHGQLTLKGITKPVGLHVEYSGVVKDPWGGERAGFSLTAKINRSDWGITFNSVLETGGLALGDEIKIFGELQLVKEAISVAA